MGGNCVAGPAQFLFWKDHQPHSINITAPVASELLLNSSIKVSMSAVVGIRAPTYCVPPDWGGTNVGKLQSGDIFPFVANSEIVYPLLNLGGRNKGRSSDFEV